MNLPDCPVETTLLFLGDKEKVLIVGYLLDGPLRPSVLQKKIGSISKNVMNSRLRELEEIADALGIGSCYLGAGWSAFADPYGQEIFKKWKIRTDYYAVMQLLLRYPKVEDKHPEPKNRKDNRILRV